MRIAIGLNRPGDPCGLYDQLLAVAQAILAGEDFVANEKGRRAERAALDRALRVRAMANELTLWGSGAGRTLRAHSTLLDLGLKYEFHPIGSRIGGTRSAELMRLNPRRKIPVLRHGANDLARLNRDRVGYRQAGAAPTE